ncbi:MAG: hypothetical protein ACRDNZ_15355 [Streptosporangiaceae bacterium]
MKTTVTIASETRARLGRIAAEDFGGASMDETISQLLDAYFMARVEAAYTTLRNDPEQWADYLGELGGIERVQAPVVE